MFRAILGILASLFLKICTILFSNLIIYATRNIIVIIMIVIDAAYNNAVKPLLNAWMGGLGPELRIIFTRGTVALR
jgi:hypothetical protein